MVSYAVVDRQLAPKDPRSPHRSRFQNRVGYSHRWCHHHGFLGSCHEAVALAPPSGWHRRAFCLWRSVSSRAALLLPVRCCVSPCLHHELSSLGRSYLQGGRTDFLGQQHFAQPNGPKIHASVYYGADQDSG